MCICILYGLLDNLHRLSFICFAIFRMLLCVNMYCYCLIQIEVMLFPWRFFFFFLVFKILLLDLSGYMNIIIYKSNSQKLEDWTDNIGIVPLVLIRDLMKFCIWCGICLELCIIVVYNGCHIIVDAPFGLVTVLSRFSCFGLRPY